MADANPLRRKTDTPANTGDAGRKYEKRNALSLRAQLQPGSGNIATAKGDFKLDREKASFLVENKSSQTLSFVLQLGHLVKISEEAAEQGKTPALAFGFVLQSGRPRPNAPTEWVCIPKSMFEALIGD